VIALPRGEGAGKAGWPLHPGPRAEKICASAKTTGTDGDTPAFPARWFYDLYALPGEPFRLPPLSAQCAGHCRQRGARPRGARTTRLRRPQMSPLVSQRVRVHRIPRLTSRDDRDPSLCKRGGIPQGLRFSRKLQARYFCCENLNRPARLILLGKFRFTRSKNRKGFVKIQRGSGAGSNPIPPAGQITLHRDGRARRRSLDPPTRQRWA
jgi:hypothetical protein